MNQNEIVSIDLKNILLTPAMSRGILNLSPDMDLTGYTRIPSQLEVGDLGRLDMVCSAIENNIPLPPIEVTRETEEKIVRKWVPSRMSKDAPPQYIHFNATYAVVNGRHRVVCSIVNGKTHINAIIVPKIK